MDLLGLEKRRPLGRLEAYSAVRHHLGFYNNVGMTATYTACSAKDGSLQQKVFATLHHVIAYHSNLSAIPINEDQPYPDIYFARLPSIDLRTCVEFRTRQRPIPKGDEDDNELDVVLRSQHDLDFKPASPHRPCWRLIITVCPQDPESFTASWIFHHALSDGASSLLFHETFLEHLNNISPEEDASPIVPTPSTQDLLPPFEDLHPMSISWPFFLRAVGRSVLPSFFKPEAGLWTGERVRATTGASHNTTVALSADLTQRFASKCREQKTSVTAALSTLLAAILLRSVSSEAGEQEKSVRINMPIALRPFLDVEDNQMVNAITDLTTTFVATGKSEPSQSEPSQREPNNTGVTSVIKGFNWSTARRIKSELSAEVAQKGTDNPIALLKYVSDMHEYFTSKVGKDRETTAEVSNLGVWRARREGVLDGDKEAADGAGAEKNWRLGRMVLSQSVHRVGAMVSLSAVTGGDGCLVLSFNWGEPLDAEMVFLREVPGLVKEGITALANEG